MNPSSNPDRAVFEICTKSLREYLIPAPIWFRRVRELECNGPLDMILAPEADERLGDYWMVPYPYQTSVFMRFLQTKFPNQVMVGPKDLAQLGPGAYTEAIQMLTNRIDSFVENMLSEDMLAYIDSIEDYGVVINGTTGRIHPFCYSDLDHMETVSIPVICELNLAHMLGEELVGEKLKTQPGFRQYIKTIIDDWFEFNAWIQPVFVLETGDKFNQVDNHRASWIMTEASHMKTEEYIAIASYVNECIKLRTKVLRIP